MYAIIPFYTLIVFLIPLLLCQCGKQEAFPEQGLREYAESLENLRQDLRIPGLSAAIACDSIIIWSRGLGFADVKNQVPAEDTTSYMLASLTKPIAGTTLLQLLQEGLINLDDPISKYGIHLDQARKNGMKLADEDSILARHLFSHTAEGHPGSRYNYSGYRYSFLETIMEKASGKTFGELVVNRIIQPLHLVHTAPNFNDSTAFRQTGYSVTAFRRNLARPYMIDSLNQVVESKYETYFGVSAGLMTSAIDMARFSIALDQGLLLKPETLDLACSPTISTNGDTLPYGLGWFVQDFQGVRFVWHYGLWNTNSSLILRIPQYKVTLVLLANSNNLTNPFGLGSGDLFTFPAATEFIRRFILHEADLNIQWDLPASDLKCALAHSKKIHEKLLKKEIFGRAALKMNAGQTEQAEALFTLYQELFGKPLPDHISAGKPLASLQNMNDNQDTSVVFQIEEEDSVRIFAIGEATAGPMWDYGWIENSAGDTLWMMTGSQTIHAGGDMKNRLIDTTLTLAAGRYILHFKTDESHAWKRWNALPPDYAFYGILVVRE